MYQQLESNLWVPTSNGEVSPAVSMQGSNAVVIDLTIINQNGLATFTVTAQLQESNDLQNWINSAASPSTVTVTQGTANLTNIGAVMKSGATYVRVKYTVTVGASPICITSGVNTSLQ